MPLFYPFPIWFLTLVAFLVQFTKFHPHNKKKIVKAIFTQTTFHSQINFTSSNGLVHFTDPQSMDYHEWSTEMDYLNGLPYITYLGKKR